MELEEGIKLLHTLREANQVAYGFANYGMNGLRLKLYYL